MEKFPIGVISVRRVYIYIYFSLEFIYPINLSSFSFFFFCRTNRWIVPKVWPTLIGPPGQYFERLDEFLERNSANSDTKLFSSMETNPLGNGTRGGSCWSIPSGYTKSKVYLTGATLQRLSFFLSLSFSLQALNNIPPSGQSLSTEWTLN